MNKPVLVVMAAGMGSRYGGMKQIDPVGPNGQVIMDYSLYDARRAGFETVIFVIKHEIEDAFKAAIGDRVGHLPCRAGCKAPDRRPLCGHQCGRLLRPGGLSGDVRLPVHPRR